MAVTKIDHEDKYIGLSTDSKPVNVAIGSTFRENDTDIIYETVDGSNWVARDVLGRISIPDGNDAAEGTTTNTPYVGAEDGTSRTVISLLKGVKNTLYTSILGVLGATDGAAVVTDANGTVQQYLRGLVKLIVAKITVAIDSGTNLIGKVGIDQATANANEVVLKASTAVVGKVRLVTTAGDEVTDDTADAIKTLGVAGAAKLGYVGAPIVKDVATGSAAIATSSAAHADNFNLVAVSVHFNAAPTTSESLTVTLNAVDGAAYDTLLYSVNPSQGALTDILFVPDIPIPCYAGDTIDVAFTNTNTKTYGVRILTEGR